MLDRLRLPYFEFHITNVCNMTCKGCNRMSDDNFKGFSLWSQLEKTYKAWSKEIEAPSISLFGGEPFLNPELPQWIEGVRSLWPSSHIALATNGSRIRMVPDLYELLLHNRILLSVSLHNKLHRAKLLEDIKWLLKAPLTYKFDNSQKYLEILDITDANRVRVQVKFVYYFHEGPVIKNIETGKKTLQQSDPIKAHDVCHSKYCHMFWEGKLYKCGLAALFPMYDEQFGLDITDCDRKLLQSYQSLSLESTRETKKEFIRQIREPIDQCKFCPENYDGQPINAGFKNKKEWPIYNV